MQTYSYKFIASMIVNKTQILHKDEKGKEYRWEIEDLLNEYAKKGWELAAANCDNSYCYLFLKKPPE